LRILHVVSTHKIFPVTADSVRKFLL